MGMTASISRVTTDGFSAVLKVLWAGSGRELPAWQTSERPDAWNYWPREALVYEHDLPAVFAGGGVVDAPRLLALRRRTDGTIALWLEDVDGLPGKLWTIEHFADLARGLGRGQGAVATRASLPDWPWLSRRFLRQYTTSRYVDRAVLDAEDAWDHPLVRDCVPAILRTEGPRLVSERERFFGVMEQLPRTLCHLDVWPNNVLRRPDGRSVLVDWAFAGDGALGEDIGNLIPDSVFDLFLPARLLPDLEAAVFEAYMTGLREGGWRGDERLPPPGTADRLQTGGRRRHSSRHLVAEVALAHDDRGVPRCLLH